VGRGVGCSATDIDSRRRRPMPRPLPQVSRRLGDSIGRRGFFRAGGKRPPSQRRSSTKPIDGPPIRPREQKASVQCLFFPENAENRMRRRSGYGRTVVGFLPRRRQPYRILGSSVLAYRNEGETQGDHDRIVGAACQDDIAYEWSTEEGRSSKSRSTATNATLKSPIRGQRRYHPVPRLISRPPTSTRSQIFLCGTGSLRLPDAGGIPYLQRHHRGAHFLPRLHQWI